MVEWEDGQLVQGAYVEINGRQYPVVMPQYSGNTAVTAENLNKMQSDLQNEIADKNIIMVSLSANQSVEANTVTPVNFDTVNAVGSSLTFDSSTHEITCGRDGAIKINACITFNNLVVNGNTQIRIFKNGSLIEAMLTRSSSVLPQSFAIPTKLINVSAGDKITLSIGNWSGSTNIVYAEEIYTYFTIEYV